MAVTGPVKVGEFSERAKEFAFRPPKFDKRFNILTGAIRSTKTFQMLPKLTRFLYRYDVGGERIITGVSKDSIYHNVLNDLFDLVGANNYSYNRQSGELILMGSKWNVVGAKDEGSEKYIRGRTIGVAYCDELTLMPRAFYMMLIGRMSPDGARLYATTNPDHPYHWVKTDILDNEEIRHLLFTQAYTLDDNLHLGAEYLDSIKRSYAGIFYDRFILGLWVMAQGAIYRDAMGEGVFYDDSTRPLALLSRGGHAERWICCDYGTVNPMVYIDVYDDGRTAWAEREYYFDSRARNVQKTDSEYADDLINGIGEEWPGLGPDRRSWPGIIVDPSAASFKVELLHRGLYVIDANNEVEDGIRRVSSMLASRKLRIHRRCVNGIREMQTYAWDTKRSDKGKEQPIKSHDHFCFTAGTLIETPSGPIGIESLSEGDFVVTPLGRCRVLNSALREAQEVIPWNGTEVTPDHPVFTQKGWIPVRDLRDNDSVCASSQSTIKELYFGDTPTLSAGQIATTIGRADHSLLSALKRSIVRFGKPLISNLSQMASMSTTRMRTLVTIRTAISGSWLALSTTPCIAGSGHLLGMLRSFEYENSPRNGMGLQKAGPGILKWLKESRPNGSSRIIPANSAASHTGLKIALLHVLSFALTLASRLPGVNWAWTMFPGFARFVAGRLAPAATLKCAPAVSTAAVSSKSVYALRTEHGCYFANGVLVSNCDALRYFCQTRIHDWRLAAA